MTQYPFQSALDGLACNRTVGALDAVLNGIPEGACLNFEVTPLGAFVGIAAFGIFLACVRAVVVALWKGVDRPGSRRADHEPALSLREAANRVRARRGAESPGQTP